MNASTEDVRTNPFPGLRPFREDEEHLFFGRESQVDAMVDKLASARFLAVVGASGSGKSSLVNCGLRPALHGGYMASAGTAWRMAQFRPGSDPLRAMANALAEDRVLFRDPPAGDFTLAERLDTRLRMSKLGLVDVFKRARLDEGVNLLVVVDQFEELFRYRQLGDDPQERASGIGEEAVAFVNLLLEAAAQTTHPIYVVITMRSDFLGDCAQFPGLAEAINAGQYLVPRMTRDERRAAISGPVAVGGAEISPVLLTRLVNDVGDNPDQLSILQHALNRTWARWENEGGGEGPLDLSHYEAIGTMANALDQHAQKAYAELTTPRQQQICEKLFKALTDKATDPRGVRRPTPLGTLCALCDATEAEVTEVIDVFRKPSRSFLMPPASDALGSESVVDISHESLMRVWKRLDRWGDEEARSAQIYRRLAETAILKARNEADFFRDPELQTALNWREQNQPNEVWAQRYQPGFEGAMAFLEASVALRDEERREQEERRQRAARRARRILVFSLGGGAVMTVVALAAILFWWQANDLKTTAKLRETAALSGTMLPREPVKALVLALQAYGESESKLGRSLPRVDSSLLSAIQGAGWSRAFEAHEGMVSSVAFTRDGALVTSDDDGTVRLWDLRGEPIGEPLAVAERDQFSVVSATVTPDGDRVVVGGDDGTVRVWDPRAEPGTKPLRLGSQGAPVRAVAVRPDGRMIVSGSDDGSVRLWDLADGRDDARVLGMHTDWVRSVAFSPDGETIVSGSDDGSVRLWSLQGTPIGVAMKSDDAWVFAVAITPDGKTIVSGSNDGAIRLWDRTGRPIGEPRWQEGDFASLAISPDGKKIASGGFDGTVRLRSLAMGTRLKLYAEGRPKASAPRPDPARAETPIEGAATSDGANRRYGEGRREPAAPASSASGKEQPSIAIEPAPPPRSLAISQDGRSIVRVHSDGTVRLWRDQTPIGSAFGGSAQSITISRDGETIVSGGEDGTLRVWGGEGKPIREFPSGTQFGVALVAISPDGETIVSAADDGAVRLWSREGKPIGEPKWHEGGVSALAISRDGTQVVSGSDVGNLRGWEIDGEPIGEPLRGNEEVTAVAVDGDRVVSGSTDGTVRLWKLDTDGGSPRPSVSGRHRSKVTSVTFGGAGSYFVSASADGSVRLWDRDGKPMGLPFERLEGRAEVKSSKQGRAEAPVAPEDPTATALTGDDDAALDIISVGLVSGTVWRWPVGTRDTWRQQGCESVRGHAALRDPDDLIARQIAEVAEAGEQAVRIAAATCLKPGGWTKPERIRFLIERGRASAWSGSEDGVRHAVEDFESALALDPESDLDPDTPDTRDRDARETAERLATPARLDEMLTRGRQLAEEGDIDAATRAFEEALALDPEVDLDAENEGPDDPKAFAQRLAAVGLLWDGMARAQQGDVDGAVSIFEDVQKLDPDIDLDPETFESVEKDPEATARRVAARTQVWEGMQLARQGEVENAIAAFEKAQEFDLDIDLDPETPDRIGRNPQATAHWLAAEGKRWEGMQLAQQGDVDEAIAAFEKAREFDREIDLDPDTPEIETNPRAVAERMAAASGLWEAVQLAEQGDVEGAVAVFQALQTLHPGIDLDPDTPEMDQDPRTVARSLATQERIGDGIQRAMEGDVEGAIGVFEAVLRVDPETDLDPFIEDSFERDPTAAARLWAVRGKIDAGYERVMEQDVAGAITSLQQALELAGTFGLDIDLDPTTDSVETDPEATARQWAVESGLE